MYSNINFDIKIVKRAVAAFVAVHPDAKDSHGIHIKVVLVG